MNGKADALIRRALIIALEISLICPAPAGALPVYRRLLETKTGYSVNCAVCHDPSTWAPSPYAIEFRKMGRNLSAIQNLENVDPDQDGFKSAEEIKAKSNPGDRASVPGRAGKWLEDIPAFAPPKKRLKRLLGDSMQFKVFEKEIGAKIAAEIEKKLRFPLRDEDRFPVLFAAYASQDPASLAAPSVEAVAAYATTDGEDPIFLLVGLARDRKLRVQFMKLEKGLAPETVEQYLQSLTGRTVQQLLGPGVPPNGGLNPALAAQIFRAVMRSAAVIENYFPLQ